MSDDDITSHDLPSGIGADDETNPGVGVGEALISITNSADRALAALKTLAETCPPAGAPSRRRHLEIYRNGWGDAGMLCFDARRITDELIREEEEKP